MTSPRPEFDLVGVGQKRGHDIRMARPHALATDDRHLVRIKIKNAAVLADSGEFS